MPVLLEMFGQFIGGDTARRIGEQVGVDAEAAKRAIAVSVPVLIGGLARNANLSRRAADALATALDRDHDGSLLDALDDLLHLSAHGIPGGYAIDRRTLNGDGIIEHILGERRGAVELGISRASGMDVKKVNRLLAVLAPILLSALGRIKRERNLTADSLASLLNKERAGIEREVPDRSRMGLLDFLDEEDDRSLADDVAQIGASLGGATMMEKLFGRPQPS